MLFDAIIELRDLIFEDNVQDEETAIELIAMEHKVEKEKLIPYFNVLTLYKMEAEEDKRSKQGKRVWRGSEKNIIQMYMDDMLETQTKKVILKGLEGILKPTKRSYQAIGFEYYSILKTQKKAEKQLSEDRVEVPLNEPSADNEDLLTNLTSFMQNAQKLENFNLTNFFQGITKLTELATQQTGNDEKLEELENIIEQKNEQIELLQKENEQLAKDMEGIKRAIEQFDAMDGMQKIINLKEYSHRLRYMIDKFGNLVHVAD